MWDCSQIEETSQELVYTSEPTLNREICNLRGHYGYITDATFSLSNEKIVITGIICLQNKLILLASDDQTIKVWNTDNISHKTIPNPKKKSKKKNKNKG